MRLLKQTVYSILVGLLATSAQAQSMEDIVAAFKGDWFSFDRARAQNGAVCSLVLKDEVVNNAYVVQAENCGSGLDQAANWGFAEGQIGIVSAEGRVLAVLGGNQVRMTGTDFSMNRGLILERREPAPYTLSLQQAIGRQACLFVGYTDTCAAVSDVAPLLAADKDSPLPVWTAAKVNLREQPRRDAPVALVLDRDTQVKAQECLTSTDGIWCQVQINETVAWLSRNALRSEKWAVTTFVVDRK